MANKFSFIVLTILVGLLYCESRELAQPLASADLQHNCTSGPLSAVKFKDFAFVLQWPSTFCKAQSCAQIPDRFTIHGLWPQNTGNAGTDKLTDAILNPRRTALMKNWPDLKTDDFHQSKNFWHYEYNKHGAYCTNKYSAEEYLVKALTLGESFKPRAWLSRQSIEPDAKKQYARADIVAAIRSATSTTPDLQCSVIGGFSYLLEVRLCLDDKLEKFINCAGKVGRCGTSIYYPPNPWGSASGNMMEKAEELGTYEAA